jgi:23S rRNA (adenine-N6)-dimethyltransferase
VAPHSTPRHAHSRARRAFSQNFISDPAAVRRFVDAADLHPDDLVYEVGAGRGQLTGALAKACRQVIAYEVDPRMAAAVPAQHGVVVRTEDFLRATDPGEPFSVIGNIPYALTSAVVDWCLRAPSLRAATLLTQLEYARKRTGDYGRWSRLTISTWPVFEWRLAGRVARTSFRPVPRVDGGILRLARRDAPLVPPDALEVYRGFVEWGFTGIGGSLHATMARRYGNRRTASAFRATRLAPELPVGQVWPEQWLTLFRLLSR